MRITPLLPRPDPRKRLRAEAADWVVRIAANPALEDDPAFHDWLAMGEDRARAFANARLAWQIAAEVGNSVPVDQAPARRPFRLLPSPGGALGPAMACAGLAALTLTALWLDMVRPDLRLHLSADHVTRPGPAQGFALLDGTRTLLDGGSALDYAEDGATRRVTMRSGAAYFDVTKGERPFSVRLGDSEVRALGTRFEVRDCGDCMIVTLEEGRVEVLGPGGRSVAVLEPGQQLRIPARSGAAMPVAERVDLSEALAWREGRYAFYDIRLREVTGILQRRGAGAIVIANGAVADRRITGSISLADPAAELAALVEALGLRLVPLPGGQLVM